MKNSAKYPAPRRTKGAARLWSRGCTWAFCILHFTFCLGPRPARAFPPAPDGLLYGMVKDQYGTPLMNPSARVILVTPNGTQVAAPIQPGLAVGINYALNVPMDTAATADPYVATALNAGAQFKLYVTVGTSTNLPIEMAGTNAVLGMAAQQTRQDLTLGTDANGDGIPDAWERVFLAQIGANIALANLDPNADYAHDGQSLRQEFLLGNYPFNPTNQFRVQLISQSAGSAVLGFSTILGRTYTVLASPDLLSWTPVAFTLPVQGSNAPIQTSYYAADIRPLQLQTLQPGNAPRMQFFRLQLQ